MKAEWRKVPLGELVDFVGGGTPRRDNPVYWGGNIPWASVKDITSHDLHGTVETITHAGVENSATNIIEAGRVILASRVGLGKVCINRVPVAINQDLKALIPKSDNVLPRFLLHFIRSQAEAIERSGEGATVMGVTLPQLQRMKIPLPQRDEQERIVRILDATEELRRLRAQADRRTADLIPALFYDMFGDPATNRKCFPIVTLGDSIVEGPQNGLYKHASSYGDGTPILRIDGFYGGLIDDLASLKRLRLTSEEEEKYRLRPDDIVINRVNSPEYLGKSALVPFLNEPTVFESNMMRLAVDRERFDPLFLILHLQTPSIKQQIAKKAKHAIHQSSINQEDVKSLSVLRPPLPLQRQFAAQVQEIRALEARQAESRRRLDDLFQSLLHRAFQGEL